jgi:hypothetical protein
MVGRCVGHVDGADAVGQDTYALALKAAQYWAGGARAEGGGGNARLPGQGFAQAGPEVAGELLAADDGGARQHILLTLSEGGGDDDLGAGGGLYAGASGCLRSGQARHRQRD